MIKMVIIMNRLSYISYKIIEIIYFSLCLFTSTNKILKPYKHIICQNNTQSLKPNNTKFLFIRIKNISFDLKPLSSINLSHFP